MTKLVDRSYFLNGGFLGQAAGESRATLQYVGGTTANGLGTTANIVVSLTSLTGGTDSSPQTDDLVIVSAELGNYLGSYNHAYKIVGYEQIVNITAKDTSGSTLQVGYRFMDATPNTTFTIRNGTTTYDAYSIAVHVWRNVDKTTPIDVAANTITKINTVIPDPPAITPITPGAQIIVTCGGGHVRGAGILYSAPYLSNFTRIGSPVDSSSTTIGIGNVSWTSGTYDPAAWTFGGGDSVTFSCSAATFAIRPKLVSSALNPTNSGIWNLQAVYDYLN